MVSSHGEFALGVLEFSHPILNRSISLSFDVIVDVQWEMRLIVVFLLMYNIGGDRGNLSLIYFGQPIWIQWPKSK